MRSMFGIPARMARCLVTVAVLSCGVGDNDGIDTLDLTNGLTVGDLVHRGGITVVLVYSPESCFSCAGVLGRWVQLDREATDVDIALVLSREPSEVQRRQLALRRLVPAGVIEDDSDVPTDPSAYVFTGRMLTDSAIGLRDQIALLSEFSGSGDP
jgi:hypothetical protein